jgi:hypothetical protein
MCVLTGLGGEEVTPARCHYGTLPGGWIRSEGRALLPWHADNRVNMSFPVWQPYCPKCQLKPLLTPYLAVRSITAVLAGHTMSLSLIIIISAMPMGSPWAEHFDCIHQLNISCTIVQHLSIFMATINSC